MSPASWLHVTQSPNHRMPPGYFGAQPEPWGATSPPNPILTPQPHCRSPALASIPPPLSSDPKAQPHSAELPKSPRDVGAAEGLRDAARTCAGRGCPEAASTAFGALPGAGPVRVPLTSQCGRALVREAGGGRRAGDSWLPNGGRLLPAAAGPAAAPGTWAAGRGARSRGWPYRPAAARIAGKRNGAAVEVEVVGFPACSSSVCWWMKGTCCPERCG